MSSRLRIENITRGTVLAERGEVADTPWARMRGLLGRSGLAAGEALVIRPCQGVHTLFMRFPIDVVHVDGAGVVQHVVPSMGPNRLGRLVWRARYVVELPAGTAQKTGTRVGDRIALV